MTYSDRQNVAALDALAEGVAHVLYLVDREDLEVSDATYSALLALSDRLAYRAEPEAWGTKPRATLAQLALAASVVVRVC